MAGQSPHAGDALADDRSHRAAGDALFRGASAAGGDRKLRHGVSVEPQDEVVKDKVVNLAKLCGQARRFIANNRAERVVVIVT